MIMSRNGRRHGLLGLSLPRLAALCCVVQMVAVFVHPVSSSTQLRQTESVPSPVPTPAPAAGTNWRAPIECPRAERSNSPDFAPCRLSQDCKPGWICSAEYEKDIGVDVKTSICLKCVEWLTCQHNGHCRAGFHCNIGSEQPDGYCSRDLPAVTSTMELNETPSSRLGLQLAGHQVIVPMSQDKLSTHPMPTHSRENQARVEEARRKRDAEWGHSLPHVQPPVTSLMETPNVTEDWTVCGVHGSLASNGKVSSTKVNCDDPAVRDKYAPRPGTELVVTLNFHAILPRNQNDKKIHYLALVEAQLATLKADYAQSSISFHGEVYWWYSDLELGGSRIALDGDDHPLCMACMPQDGVEPHPSCMDKLARPDCCALAPKDDGYGCIAIGHYKKAFDDMTKVTGMSYDDGINVFLNRFMVENVMGYSWFPWVENAGYLVINPDFIGAHQKTLSHELGHTLGLYHVFHGAIVEGQGVCGACSERHVSDTLGDLCSDTLPAPLHFSCADPVDDVNPCTGKVFAPGTPYDNIMSYGEDLCVRTFTPDQTNRMWCWGENALPTAVKVACTTAKLCHNGGTRRADCTCSCKDNFAGAQCDVCKGTCEDGAFDTNCVCKSNSTSTATPAVHTMTSGHRGTPPATPVLTGPKTQYWHTSCPELHCLNGAIADTRDCTCVCAPTFSGPHCETKDPRFSVMDGKTTLEKRADKFRNNNTTEGDTESKPEEVNPDDVGKSEGSTNEGTPESKPDEEVKPGNVTQPEESKPEAEGNSLKGGKAWKPTENEVLPVEEAMPGHNTTALAQKVERAESTEKGDAATPLQDARPPATTHGGVDVCPNTDVLTCMHGILSAPDGTGGDCHCLCDENYTGESCEDTVCPITCKNGGALTKECTCECPKTHTGSDCGDEHCSLVCENGGKVLSASCTCKCPAFFSGENCGIHSQDGAPPCDKDCGPNGKLVLETCECTCYGEFSGKNCRNKIPAVKNSPWNVLISTGSHT